MARLTSGNAVCPSCYFSCITQHGIGCHFCQLAIIFSHHPASIETVPSDACDLVVSTASDMFMFSHAYHRLLSSLKGKVEEVDEIVEDDRVMYSDQLCAIGALARNVPEQTLPLLYTSVVFYVGS